MSTIKGVDCIRIQRYNENSNAGHNAQPDMYTVTNARSLIYIQSGVQSIIFFYTKLKLTSLETRRCCRNYQLMNEAEYLMKYYGDRGGGSQWGGGSG